MKTDLQIQKVMEAVKWQPSLELAQIGVVVKDGVVRLDGDADWESQHRAKDHGRFPKKREYRQQIRKRGSSWQQGRAYRLGKIVCRKRRCRKPYGLHLEC